MQRIVADIGGTRGRFARAGDDGVPVDAVEFACADHRDPAALVAAAVAYLGSPDAFSLAVAGPVADGRARLVNRGWTLDAAALSAAFERPVRLWNDFAALARGAAAAGPERRRPLGGERPAPPGPVGVIGPGTGLGTALVTPDGRVWPSEGGHADLAPTTAFEAELLAVLRRRWPRVSAERVLSGPGLVNLHQALATLEGVGAELREPAAVVAAARGGDAVAARTLSTFTAWLGATAGNFALTTGARALVLAGGLSVRLADEIADGPFRARLEAKGRVSDWVRPLPVDLLLDEHAGLRGAALLAAEVPVGDML
jgi:glucokinase